MSTTFPFDPNLIQWFDGMVLSCHQFQQEQIRMQNGFHYLMRNSYPYGWGLIRLELDLSSLQNNILKLTEIECILPDYTLLFFPMYEEKPIECNLQSTGPGEKCIYLVLSDGYECNEAGRYQSMHSHTVTDMNTGSNKQQLVRLVPRIALTAEKPAPNLVSIPLLKYTRSSEEGKITLTTYDPPVTDFHKATNAKNRLDSVLNKLQTKLQEAYTKLRIKGQDDDFKHYGYLILREIWPLQSLLNSKSSNPFYIYQQLVRLCASLTLITDSVQPSINDVYDHLDIYGSFAKLCSFIDDKVSMINQSYSLGLEAFKYDANRYSTIIKITESGYVKFMAQFQIEEDFQSWISNAIIASHNAFEEVKLQRTIGCEREILDTNRIVENKRCVTVKVKLNKDCIKSNLLYISNVVHTNFKPIMVYLLDD